MAKVTDEQIDNWFTYHAPSGPDLEMYNAIRTAGRHLAQVIVQNTPASADSNAALRKLREAVMTANAAIACGAK